MVGSAKKTNYNVVTIKFNVKFVNIFKHQVSRNIHILMFGVLPAPTLMASDLEPRRHSFHYQPQNENATCVAYVSGHASRVDWNRL